MKTFFFSTIILGIFISLYSCSEVIELDIVNAEPQIVIEGSVGNNGDTAEIKISKSVGLFADNIFPVVSNATVILSDNLGNRDTLIETTAGIYKSFHLFGQVGNTYHLEVQAENKVLESVSNIPNQVNFDTLIIRENTSVTGPGGPGGPGGGTVGEIRYQVFVVFQDPSTERNYYRFIEYVNSVQKSRIYISDDRLTNGLTNNLKLRNSRNYKSGDIVTFEMQCIDKAIYDYFNSFENLSGGPQSSSTPATPYTNIIGSKLGYFSAHTVQRISYTIP
jgi:hypothetical protein